MKQFLFFFLFLICNQTFGQNNNQIVIGKVEKIHSTILNEHREVLVYVPRSWDGASRLTRYPVMYVLEGYAFFHSVSGIVDYLSSVGKMPEMIIVSVTHADRVKDLTPTHYTKSSDGEDDLANLKNSGGGKKFMSFLQEELMPRIDSLYPTAPYRMFVGHSLGGLTVINTLIHKPELFNSYVAIDPSMWWDKQLPLRQAEKVLQERNYAGKSLFFASANTLHNGADTPGIAADTAHSSLHVRDNLKFRELLIKNKQNNLTWNWKYYADDNHASVPLIAEYDAFRFVFKSYDLPSDLNDPLINAEFLKDHYRNVSAMMGYPVLPSQRTVNMLGYIALNSKLYDKAYKFFRMNLDNFPDNFNLHDSMGDYYLAIGDKSKAIAAFTKALSLKEYPEGRKKLNSLK